GAFGPFAEERGEVDEGRSGTRSAARSARPLLPAPPEGPSGELQQATPIRRRHRVDVREHVQLAVRHPDGDLREPGAEEPAEPAAIGVSVPWHDVGAACAEESERLVVNPELAERVTPVMVGYAPAGEPRPQRAGCRAQDVDEELGELPGTGAEGGGCGRSEELAVEPSEHPRTAAGGEHHVVRVRERGQRVPRHADGRLSGPGAVAGLAAASLPHRDLDHYTEMPEDPHGVRAGVGEETIGQARGEQRDAGGRAGMEGGRRAHGLRGWTFSPAGVLPSRATGPACRTARAPRRWTRFAEVAR